MENKSDYGMLLEQLVLNFFTRDEGQARELLAEAVAACAPAEKTISIFTADGRTWIHRAAVPVRCPGSLVLREGQFEELADDVRRFFERKDWYRQVGIPHRRGYLLTGPPGNGKTTTILVLAGMFDAPLCIVDLASPLMSDDKLRDLMASAPAGAFFLFEDIDAMFGEGAPTASRLVEKEEQEPWDREQFDSAGLSLSGLLNAIDGVASPSGRVVFMSTNHPEKLDPALIRPSRVDRRVELANATEEQAARMFVRFFPDWLIDPALVEGGAQMFGEMLGSGSVSMATVQGVLIEGQEDPRKALELAEKVRRASVSTL